MDLRSIGVAILITDKIDFKPKLISRDREGKKTPPNTRASMFVK